MSRRLAITGAVLLGALLAVLGLASRTTLEIARPTVTARPTATRTPRITLSPSMVTPPGLPPDQPEPVKVPEWVQSLLALALAAIIVGAIVLVASRLRRLQLNRVRRRETAQAGEVVELSEEDVRALGEGIRETMARLRVGGDVDEAILFCWRRVEDVAARQGLPRRPSQTSEEFTVDVLARTRARRPDMEQLAALYRAAMFSARTSTQAEREAALACLANLSRDLVVRPAEAPTEEATGEG